MLLGKYKNGTYYVSIYDDGTKIRTAPNDEFIPDFSESCDVTITEYCDGGCAWCYAGCSLDGKHCDFNKYDKLLDSLHPYTELAINGNDLTHPQLIQFLEKMQQKKIIVSMTVNQMHFEKNIELLRDLCNKKLIYGLGISLRNANKEFVKLVQEFPNAVIHIINGLFTPDEYEVLKNNNLKVLILGYKQIGRGVDWYKQDNINITNNQKWLTDILPNIINDFKVVSFDNLSLKQLEVRRLMSTDEWEQFYMGNDATFTYFINLVQDYFAPSSLSDKHYPINNMNIDEMFKIIRNNNRVENSKN
jgi:hypothetical protein